MRKFGYARDPLCIAACVGYAVNRWLIPGALKGVFLHGYFSDTLLIPAAMPLMLWLQRRLGMRTDDDPPRWSEIVMHVIVWSIAAEVVAPHFFARATADPWDAVSYAAGALVAGIWWRRP